MNKFKKGAHYFFTCKAGCTRDQRWNTANDPLHTTCNKCLQGSTMYDKHRHRMYTCKTCLNTGRASGFGDLVEPKCKTCAMTDGDVTMVNERDFKHMVTKREKKALAKDRPPYADPTEKESMAECHPGRVKAIETAIKNLKSLNFGSALEVACGGGKLTKDLLANMFQHTDMFDRCPAAQRDV